MSRALDVAYRVAGVATAAALAFSFVQWSARRTSSKSLPHDAGSPPAPEDAGPPGKMRVSDAWSALCDAGIPMEVAGSREFVHVTIAGQDLRFHVDTGGNTAGLMLTRSVAKRLGFESADALPRTIHIGDRDVAFPPGASWTLFDDASDEGRMLFGGRKDFSVGQIGAGFLSRFVVCIDPAHGKLGLGDPARFDLDDSHVAEPLFVLQEGANHALYPFVHLEVRNGAGRVVGGYGMLLDTGATTTMLDRGALDAERKILQAPHARGAAGDADMPGGLWPEEMVLFGDVAITGVGGDAEPFDLGPARVVDRSNGTWERMFGPVGPTIGSHGALANDVLLRFRLLLDYPRSRVFLEPTELAENPSASERRVGVSLRFGGDGCPEVRVVTDTNTPETRARLHVGDVILRVGELDACHAWHHEIAAALAGDLGNEKHLKVRRGGVENDVTVTVGELLQ